MSLYAFESSAYAGISDQSSRYCDKTMAHKVDGKYQTPTICQCHDNSLQRCQRNSRGNKEVDKPKEASSKNHRLVTCIFAKGVFESAFWFPISSIRVLSKYWQNEPERRSEYVEIVGEIYLTMSAQRSTNKLSSMKQGAPFRGAIFLDSQHHPFLH